LTRDKWGRAWLLTFIVLSRDSNFLTLNLHRYLTRLKLTDIQGDFVIIASKSYGVDGKVFQWLMHSIFDFRSNIWPTKCANANDVMLLDFSQNFFFHSLLCLFTAILFTTTSHINVCTHRALIYAAFMLPREFFSPLLYSFSLRNIDIILEISKFLSGILELFYSFIHSLSRFCSPFNTSNQVWLINNVEKVLLIAPSNAN
jgi:hypothetical protein